MEPLVSIIVPAWNCARWITATLESVYAQTYRNWEIILVDDGSTDDTRSILDRHMVRLRYYYQEHRGTAAARNAGLRKARGELIAFLDDDDLWLPRKLELQVKALQAASECGLVFTDGRVFTDDGSRLHSVLSWRLDPWIARCTTADGLTAKGWLFRELFLANEIFSASSVLVSKQCIERVGGFDEKIRLADDYDLWLRIALRYPVILVRTCLYMWRWRDDSQSGPINDRQYRWAKASIAVVEKHLANAPSEIRATVRLNLGRMYWLCARVLFGQNQLRESRRMFIGCLRHNSRRVSPWIFLLASYLSPGLIRMFRSINHGARVSWPLTLFRKSAPVSVVEAGTPFLAALFVSDPERLTVLDSRARPRDHRDAYHALPPGAYVAMALRINGPSRLARLRILLVLRFRAAALRRALAETGAVDIRYFGLCQELEEPTLAYELGSAAERHAERGFLPRSRSWPLAIIRGSLRRWSGCHPSLDALFIVGRKP